MTDQDLIVQQMGLVYRAVEANVNGMSHEGSLARPAKGGNCANWILAHLTTVQNGVMRILGAEPVWENPDLEGVESDPIEGTRDAFDWETLRSRFLDSRERCLEGIESLTEERLADQLPHPLGGEATRSELLSFLTFHQAYHAGQLGVLRRVAGLEGAIRAPGQDD